jgi:probable HAF family extracellular repeat protein
MKPTRLFALAVLVITGSVCAVHAQPLYTAKILDATTGAQAIAYALNNSDVVVGQQQTPGIATYAFQYSVGTMTNLTAYANPGSYTFVAYGINDSGTTVGILSITSGSNYIAHAFSYSNGTLTDLGSLGSVSNGLLTDVGSLQGVGSSAAAINNLGTIVGDMPSGGVQAFSYSNGVMTALGTLNGYANSAASAISDSGIIVGNSLTNGYTESGVWGHGLGGSATGQAFIYQNGVMTGLGFLTGPAFPPNPVSTSGATGVNNAGTVVGWSNTGGVQHAFSYSNGTMTDLGTLGGTGGYGSWANGVNDWGVIVGYADTASGAQHAFIYANGVMIDLNSLVNLPGVTLTNAYAVNNAGEVVAQGNDNHAYLLTSVPIQGPAGPAGATGPTGATGAAGPVGATGAVGPAGPAGATGPSGAVGPTGANGAVGPAGPQGATGATGAPGATGAVGPQGPIGPAAPIGVFPIRIVTSDVTLTVNDTVVIADSTKGDLTVTLPNATQNKGRYFVIKRAVSGHKVTIQPPNGETIDTDKAINLTGQGSTDTVISDGANWVTISFDQNAS